MPTAAKKAAAAKPAAAKKTAAPKPPKEPTFCLSGSGKQTKGGLFAPGGDAKYKSLLIEHFKAGTQVPADRKFEGKRDPMEIATALDARKEGSTYWTSALTKAKETAVAKANRPRRQPRAPKGGPVAVGATVEFQYRGKKRSGEVTEVAGQRAKVAFKMDAESDTETRAFGIESLTVTKAALAAVPDQEATG